jgi:hypothetical protein
LRSDDGYKNTSLTGHWTFAGNNVLSGLTGTIGLLSILSAGGSLFRIYIQQPALAVRQPYKVGVLMRTSISSHVARVAAASIVAFGVASSAPAARLHVCPKLGRLANTINSAVDGDEVVLEPGLYRTGALDFAGKAITVRSISPENPAVVAATIIDCGGTLDSPRRGFTFRSGEGPGSVLAGLTIRNGFGPLEDHEGALYSAGGGLYIRQASPSIRNCVFDGCVADAWGGGVYCHQGSPVFSGCTFRNCAASGGTGGAIYCNTTNLTLRDCRLLGNSAGYGGAIYSFYGRLAISNCQFGGNSVTANGGAIRINTSPVDGVQILNCLLVGNSAGQQGGAVHGTGSSISALNCTFSGNGAGSLGGAIYAGASSTTTVINSILWGDTAPTGLEGALQSASTMVVSYSDVQGGTGGISVAGGSTRTWGSGNLNIDPKFVDADGQDNIAVTWEENDYHLADQLGMVSPCIDAGDPGRVYLGQTDMDGEARVQRTAADIGADEAANRRPVRNATTNYTYATIQQAVDEAGANDEIVLEPGRYAGPGNRDVDFRGKAITVRSTNPQDPAVVAGTFIDCQGSSASPHRGFVLRTGEGPGSVLDGLTIINGYAPMEVMDSQAVWAGGAVCCLGASPTIRNCVVRTNAACGLLDQAVYGAGIFSLNGSPVIEDCAISANWASGYVNTLAFGSSGDAYGAGICCLGGSATLRRNTIAMNAAMGGYTDSSWTRDSFGAGIYCTGVTMVEECLVEGNTGSGRYPSGACDGAGIHCQGTTTILNCTITRNDALNDWSNDPPRGGGISCSGTTFIRNCDVTGNYCAWGNGSWRGGAGIYCLDTTHVEGCLIVGNATLEVGGGIRTLGNLTVTNCMIVNNSADAIEASEYPGGGGICGGGVIRNCLIAGNRSRNGGGLYIHRASTLAGCTIAGNTATGYGGGVYGAGTVANCILWSNTAEQAGPQLAAVGAMTVTHSDVQAGQASVFVGYGGPLTWGIGNIDVDPLFVDADGPDDGPDTWQDNEFHLSHGSPCINAGANSQAAMASDLTISNSTPVSLAMADISKFAVGDQVEYDGTRVLRTAVQVDVPTHTLMLDRALLVPSEPGKVVNCYGAGDLDGRCRVLLGYVDMGAYELQPFYPGDLTGDGNVDVVDLLTLVDAWGTEEGDGAFDPAADTNGDCFVDVVDLLTIVYDWGQTVAAEAIVSDSRSEPDTGAGSGQELVWLGQ